jgi:uncharacterized membrane protein
MTVIPTQTITHAAGVNASGVVVGDVASPNGLVPFQWSASGGLGMLPLLRGYTSGYAVAINAGGDILGINDLNCDYYCYGLAPQRFVLWNAAGEVTDPGDLLAGATGAAINIHGQVVGTIAGRAFIWSKTGGLQDLGVLRSHANSSARGINDAGQVVGGNQ